VTGAPRSANAGSLGYGREFVITETHFAPENAPFELHVLNPGGCASIVVDHPALPGGSAPFDLPHGVTVLVFPYTPALVTAKRPPVYPGGTNPPHSTLPAYVIRVVDADPAAVIGLLSLNPKGGNVCSDATMHLPVTELGTHHRLGTWVYGSASRGPTITAVAVEDDTAVTVTQKIAGGPPPAVVATRLLDRGQYFAYQWTNNMDTTSSLLAADKPLAVYSGNHNTLVGPASAGDHLVEVALPVDGLGDAYPVFPTHNRPFATPGVDDGGPCPWVSACTPDHFKVVATQDGTTIVTVPPTTCEDVLNTFQFSECATDQPFVIRSEPPGMPFYVYHFSEGGVIAAGGLSDGDMWVSIPPERYTSSAMFSVPDGFVHHYLHVIAPVGAAVRLDCQLQAVACIPIGEVEGVEYCGMTIPIDAASTPEPVVGAHVLTAAHPEDGPCAFTAYVTGYGTIWMGSLSSNDSYGYAVLPLDDTIPVIQCSEEKSCPPPLTSLEPKILDMFGKSLSISGDRMVVGAPSSECTAYCTPGAVYTFEWDGTEWVRNDAVTLDSGSGLPQDSFGWSVSLDGDKLAVGAPKLGLAYAYEWDGVGLSWTLENRLTSGDTSGGFGYSVALEQDRLVVGAPWEALGGPVYHGAAYVFEHGAGGWSGPSPPITGDTGSAYEFGATVALSDDTIAVSAPYSDRVHVFFGAPSWAPEQVIGTSGAGAATFGRSLALEGDRLVIGAPIWYSPPPPDSGFVEVHDRVAAVWGLETTLVPSDPPQAGAFFGASVALQGHRIAVGAPFADRPANLGIEPYGAAYVFEQCEKAWTGVEKVVPPLDYLPTGEPSLSPWCRDCWSLFGISVDLAGGGIPVVGHNYAVDWTWYGAAFSCP
jgi:hypothetical protein